MSSAGVSARQRATSAATRAPFGPKTSRGSGGIGAGFIDGRQNAGRSARQTGGHGSPGPGAPACAAAGRDGPGQRSAHRIAYQRLERSTNTWATSWVADRSWSAGAMAVISFVTLSRRGPRRRCAPGGGGHRPRLCGGSAMKTSIGNALSSVTRSLHTSRNL